LNQEIVMISSSGLGKLLLTNCNLTLKIVEANNTRLVLLLRAFDSCICNSWSDRSRSLFI